MAQFLQKISKYKLELILAVIVLASRLPLMSKYFYSWDAAQLSLAFKHFDISMHQPHPPGYILYVFLGKLIFYLTGNANLAYVILSIIATIVAAVLFYHLLKLLLKDIRTSFLISLALVFNPYFWYYGEVTSTYIFDALFSMLFVYFAVLIIKKEEWRYFYYFSAALALSGGFRQSIVILFVPMWVYLLVLFIIRKNFNLKKILISCLVGLLFLGVWLVPLLIITGGWHEWWGTSQYQWSAASQPTSIFADASLAVVKDNFLQIVKVSLAVINACLLGIIALLFGWKKWRNFSIKNHLIRNPQFYLFVLWLGASYFVYIFMHFGNRGYLMTVVAAFVIMLLNPIVWFAKNKWVISLIIIILLAEIGSFLAIDSSLVRNNNILNRVRTKIYSYNIWKNYFAYQGIRGFDDEIGEYLVAIEKYNPETTAVMTHHGWQYRLPGSETWVRDYTELFRHYSYYLPQYSVYETLWGNSKMFFYEKDHIMSLVSSQTISLPAKINKIVIIAEEIDRDIIKKDNIKFDVLPSGRKLFYINLSVGSAQPYGNYTINNNLK
ncbi:MAG: glycosyltransferase family 39 protein [Patescibacteria group bacterium]|jgi:hypothetical protein